MDPVNTPYDALLHFLSERSWRALDHEIILPYMEIMSILFNIQKYLVFHK